MDTLTMIMIGLDAIILVTVLYMILFAIPKETKELRECSVRVLCKEGMLKGEICNPYKTTDYQNFTIPNFTL